MAQLDAFAPIRSFQDLCTRTDNFIRVAADTEFDGLDPRQNA